MAKQMTAMNGAPAGSSKGWLLWWTIREVEQDAQAIKDSAGKYGIPNWMIDRIKGRTDRSAWQAATQLGAQGKPSASLAEEPKDSRARYLTRDLETESRAIIREVTLPSQELVRVDTVAIVDCVSSKGSKFHYRLAQPPIGSEGEVHKLMRDMEQTWHAVRGKIDAGRIRSLVLDWLDHVYRVCVRGTGGVYFIPRPREDFHVNIIVQEMLAIRDWITCQPVGGFFSIVELYDAGSTTMDSFVKSAMEEVKSDLEDVDGRLDKWGGNTSMNDGSVMFSASQMVDKLDAIKEKIRVLKDSLGEELAVLDIMLFTVRGKATKMQIDASSAVSKAKAEKTSLLQQEREERMQAAKEASEKAKAIVDKKKSAKGGNGDSGSNDKSKKRGTARSRSKAAKL